MPYGEFTRYLFIFLIMKRFLCVCSAEEIDDFDPDRRLWHLPKIFFPMNSVPDPDPTSNKKINQEEPWFQLLCHL
jgi:hypothetical protein